jgi:predicted O-methyltransferase YrrM
MGLREEYLTRCATTSDINEHLPTLFGYVVDCERPDPVVLELGTRSGNSTAAFLYALQIRQDGILHSVDLDTPGVPDLWFADTTFWRFHLGSDIAGPVMGRLPQQVDVLFVDTSHTYEHTMIELTAYMPRVRPGGVALFHDTQIVSDVCHVARALDEYCRDVQGLWHPDTELSWTEDPRNNGLGMIRVPA